MRLSSAARPLIFFLVVLLSAGWLSPAQGELPAPLVVAQDGSGQFNGTDEQPLLAALAKIPVTGGEIVIRPGTYTIHRSLVLKGQKRLRIRGEAGAVLKLCPLQYGEVETAAAVGETTLRLKTQQGLEAGMQLQIMAPGPIEPVTGKPRPTFVAALARIEERTLHLAKPLPYAVPAGTCIMHENAPNLFDLREGCAEIHFQDLTLDGGRVAADPPIAAHVQRCGILASGPYDYTLGLKGEPIRGLKVENCVIRQCFGRGIALYAVHDAEITKCQISDTLDEAIDLDHFTQDARVVGNELTRARIGVELNDANDCLVQGNTISHCDVGLKMWRWCKMPELNVRNLLLENRIGDSREHGISLAEGTSQTMVRGNRIARAGRSGISVQGTDSTIIGNAVEGLPKNALVIGGSGHTVLRNSVEAAAPSRQR